MNTIAAVIASAALLVTSATAGYAGVASHDPLHGVDSATPRDWVILRPGLFLFTINGGSPSVGGALGLDIYRDVVGLRLNGGVALSSYLSSGMGIGIDPVWDLSLFAVAHPLPFEGTRRFYLLGGRQYYRPLFDPELDRGAWVVGAGVSIPVGDEGNDRSLMPELRLTPGWDGRRNDMEFWAGVTFVFGEY